MKSFAAVRRSQITHTTVRALYAVYVGKTEDALEEIFKDTHPKQL
jgi:hypothetical protein